MSHIPSTSSLGHKPVLRHFRGHSYQATLLQERWLNELFYCSAKRKSSSHLKKLRPIGSWGLWVFFLFSSPQGTICRTPRDFFLPNLPKSAEKSTERPTEYAFPPYHQAYAGLMSSWPVWIFSNPSQGNSTKQMNQSTFWKWVSPIENKDVWNGHMKFTRR